MFQSAAVESNLTIGNQRTLKFSDLCAVVKQSKFVIYQVTGTENRYGVAVQSTLKTAIAGNHESLSQPMVSHSLKVSHSVVLI